MERAFERTTHPSWERYAPSLRGYRFIRGMKIPTRLEQFDAAFGALGRQVEISVH